MELQRERPPDFFAHSPDQLRLPAVPTHDLAPVPHVHQDITLPDLKTVLSPEFQQATPIIPTFATHGSPSSIRSIPPIDSASMQANGTRRSLESAIVTLSENESAISGEDRGGRSTSVVSMEDPDVRIAAEALSGLGNPDFARSPPNLGTHVPSYGSLGHSYQSHNAEQEPEPLFELLMQRHPWVGGTINGSLSAYSTTKYYSPRLVQMGANLIERNVTTPVVNTVGSVGRMTGAETVARWYLTPRRPSDADPGDEEAMRSKRRRLIDDEVYLESGLVSPRSGQRRDSQESRTESLPAYRPSKPPSYREEESPTPDQRSRPSRQPAHLRNFSSQVFVMTSGLGVALSVTSRRSLNFCINMLTQSAVHIQTVTNALKIVLEQYNQQREHWHRNNNHMDEKGERPQTPEHDQGAQRLAEIIKKHSDDIWQTLKNVVNSVSNAAGGALPDNARHFVRTQLMSLPQRWRFVSEGQTGESETSRSAHRMIGFAMEGLDMISQVNQVCQSTLDSAERWLERVGRRQATDHAPPNSHYDDKDREMIDAPPT